MSSLARLVREPLLHFLLIGAAIFAIAAQFGSREPAARDRIVVTEGRVEQLVRIFAMTWQRPPTAQERLGLIETYVREEVYYREALKAGLDRDDTVVRRRMQQKMMFLTEPDDAALAATDADLEAYLATNRADFRIEAQLAFQHIFVDPRRSPDPAAGRAGMLLKEVSGLSAGQDLSQLGDPTLLPRAVPLAPVSAIDGRFGKGFGERLTDVPLDTWSGPIESSYGLHVVRVAARRAAYDPPLEEVRAAVESAWRNAKREEFRKAEYDRLRAGYDIVLPKAEGGAQPARVTP